MMWDFMDVIDAIRDRDINNNKCGGVSGLRDDEKFFQEKERCGPNTLCPRKDL